MSGMGYTVEGERRRNARSAGADGSKFDEVQSGARMGGRA